MQIINFEPGVINTKNCSNCRFGNGGICPTINVCVASSLDQSPSHWMKMTDAQKLEKEMSNIKTDKKLVGNISSGYSYIDTKYNEMFRKENKKMDIKLYECGIFVGRVVTKPQDLIKNVIFSGPCTIVQWSDGDKTIVRCANEDFDKEKGLAMAIIKKLFGTNESKSNYNDISKKWIHEEKKVSDVILKTKKETRFLSVKKYAALAGVSESTIRKQLRKGQYPYANKVNGKWQIPYSTDKPEVVEKIRGRFK